MKSLIFLIGLIVIIASCATAEKKESADERNLKLLEENANQNSADDKDKNFESGKKLLLDGKIEAAISYLEKSNSKETPFFLGLAYYTLEKFDKAEPLLQKSFEENIYPEESAYNLAFIAYEKGDESKAVNLMKKVIETKPEHAGANYFLGSWFYKNGDYNNAVSHYKKTVKSEPAKSAGWEGLFYAYVAADNYAEAWDLRENLDKKEASLIYNLMLVAEKIKKFEEGIKIAKESGLKTEDIESERIILTTKSGKIDESIKEARELIGNSDGFVLLDRNFGEHFYWALIAEKNDINLLCKKNNSETEKEIKAEIKNGTISFPQKKKSFNSYDLFSKEAESICGM